jgi:hypothetical protein
LLHFVIIIEMCCKLRKFGLEYDKYENESLNLPS